jgi:ATP-dependent Lon protease
LVGPPGTGKTTFAQKLAQALKKEFFSFSLGGMTDSSLLTGKEEEIGLLTNALLKNNSINSLFLLDEIDKTSIRVQDSLINVLDRVQNASFFNHYLDVNLDFSPITFVVTANNLKKISESLLSRMTIIELSDYTVEQKKEIAQKIIQK